jgi:hypothetical protein
VQALAIFGDPVLFARYNPVVALAAIDPVYRSIGRGVYPVIAITRAYVVLALGGVDAVRPNATKEGVAALLAVEVVSPVRPLDGIVARSTEGRVVSITPQDVVPACQGVDRIVIKGSDDLIVFLRATTYGWPPWSRTS